jgi:lipase
VKPLQQRLGADFELLDFDCQHMISETRPADVAALIRTLLKAS